MMKYGLTELGCWCDKGSNLRNAKLHRGLLVWRYMLQIKTSRHVSK